MSFIQAQSLTWRWGNCLVAVVPIVALIVFDPCPAMAQFPGRPFRTQAGPVSVFLPAPRELQRELDRAKSDIEAEKFVDSITRLNLILGAEDERASELDEDYFLPANGSETLRSLRLEAERLIGSLPPKGIAAYELAYGTEARQMLRDGVARRDFELIGMVSRRFGHTRAGQEATMILGRDHLARGDALEAVMHFRRLAGSKVPSSRFGVELQMLLAISLRLSHREQEALQVLDEHRLENKDAEVRIAGKSTPWFQASDQPSEDGQPDLASAQQWLTALVGEVESSESEAVSDWRMFGGNPSRSAIGDVDMPARSMRWDLPFAIRIEEEKLLERHTKSLSDQAITPALHPLVVDDWVLMRSADHLWGVELETGRRIWQYPWAKESQQPVVPEGTRFGARGSRRPNLVKQRVWQDALYGQLSSDGDAVYLLSKLTGDYYTRPTGAPLTNELTSLDLEREGYTLWVVGGEDGRDEKELAGVFFLGAPLPIAETLYCLGELNGEIRLLALSSESGKLLWSQQIAHIDVRPSQDRGGARRLAGLNLSHADGILVCPTSVGGVVAIDLARRMFLWGYQYDKKNLQSRTTRSRTQSGIANTWRDNSTLIKDGRVVLTPWDSTELYCLDLLTGKNLWSKPRARGSNIYVAGVHGDNVILVGKTNVSAIDLNTGKNRWSLKLRDAPSGRGVQSGAHYLLATTTPEVVKIDLNVGKIVQTIATDEPLGNLVAARGHIISQNPKRLRSFYQRDKLQKRVDETLARTPTDPWALEHLAILLLENGEREKGLDSLRRAIANYPQDDSGADLAAKKLLVNTSLDMLRENVPGATELAREIKPFIAAQTSTKDEFLRVMAVNLQREGRVEEALEQNLELFQSSRKRRQSVAIRDRVELMRADKQRRIRNDRWHRALFRNLWEQADDNQRSQIEKLVSLAIEDAKPEDASRLVTALQDIPVAQPSLLRLIGEQIESKSTTAITEGQLLRLSKSDDASLAGQATAMLADLYRTSGTYDAAIATFGKLQRDFRDDVVRDGLTGSEVVRKALSENATLQGYVEQDKPWNYGQVRTVPFKDVSRARVGGIVAQPFDTLTRLLPLDHQTPYAQTPNGWQLVFDQLSKRLEGRDAMGNVHSIAALNAALPGVRGRDLQIRTNGHYIVCVRGESLVAINALGSSQGSDEAILWQDSGQNVGVSTRSLSSVRTIRFGELGMGVSRTVASGRNGNSPIWLGAVTDHGIVLRRYGELICLDPVSGEPVWIRNDVDMSAEVWGDDHHIFVHVPGIKPTDRQNARVFSTMDGSELVSQPIPDRRNRIRAFGRHVLSWEYDLVDGAFKESDEVLREILKRVLDGDYDFRKIPTIPAGAKKVLRHRISLKDIFDREKTAEWSHLFGIDSRAAFVGDSELAVYDPDARRFCVVSVIDGKLIVDQRIEVSLPKVDTLNVEKRAGLYIASLGQNTTGRKKNKVVYRSPQPTTKLANLEVFAFNALGEKVWSVPAKFESFVQAAVYATDVPILVFIRTDQTKSKRFLDTVVLDARDGRAIFEDSSLLEGHTFQVRGDPEVNQVRLRVPATGGAWKLDFSNEPRPPVPPYGYESTATKQRGVVDRAVGSVIDLFRSVTPKLENNPPVDGE